MKKLFISVSSLFSYLFLALPASAQTGANPCAAPAGIAIVLCSFGGDKVGKTIQNIVVFIVVLAVIIALLYLLYGGVKWITSKGDKTEVEAARNHIIAAITGLIVVILAVFIISIILAAFGLKFDQLVIPSITTNTTPIPITPTPPTE